MGKFHDKSAYEDSRKYESSEIKNNQLNETLQWLRFCNYHTGF
jgi:hypothetical protein